MSRQIIWTRAADEWEHDRDIFGPDLDRVIRVPCLRLKMLSAPWPSLVSDQADPLDYVVCFTSQKAVEAVPHNVAAWMSQVKQVLTFGEQTQQAILSHGWNGLRLPAPGGLEFSRLLLVHLDPRDKVLICSAQDPAYPIADDVKRAGFAVEQLALYATETGVFTERGADLGKKGIDGLASRLHGVVCFASPSAVRGFAEGFADHPDLFQGLRAVAIGETTASEVTKYFAQVKTVARPQRSLLYQAARDWA